VASYDVRGCTQLLRCRLQWRVRSWASLGSAVLRRDRRGSRHLRGPQGALVGNPVSQLWRWLGFPGCGEHSPGRAVGDLGRGSPAGGASLVVCTPLVADFSPASVAATGDTGMVAGRSVLFPAHAISGGVGTLRCKRSMV
jgi:hypothetical protein